MKLTKPAPARASQPNPRVRQLGAPWRMDYERMLQSGIKPNLPKLTLARRIAAIVLSMWKREEVYDPERHKPVMAKSWLLGSALRSSRIHRSPAARAGAGARVNFSLDNSFLRS